MQTDRGFCWLDGFFHKETETPVDSRLFHTGMVVREEIRTRGTRMAFFQEHYEQLESRLNLLKITLPDIMTAGEIHQQAVNLINKNRYFGGNCLRITIIHETGNDPGTSHCLMECTALDHPAYVLNRKGYILGIYDDLNIPLDRLTGKFARSPLLDFFARGYMTAKGWDDCLLLNQQGHIVESIFSSLFVRIRGKIYTPPLRDGASHSVMRTQVIRLLSDTGEPVNDKISLRIVDLEKAEEIMLANALAGIRWVVALSHHRYYNHTGARITGLLNERAFGRD